ncbi:MAG: arylsulfotransferase family protein [Salinisphaera sp.]|nr:arylsulfotransferase family protein [Salinisphaera sp.]
MTTSKTEKIGSFVFVLAVLFLVFVAGAVLTLAKLPPTQFIGDAYEAALALFQQKTAYRDPVQTNFWNPARSKQRGVTILDAQRVQPGYTLYTSADCGCARLINARGDLIYEWDKPYSTVWHKGAAVKDPVRDEQVFMREARVYPNGDLLALYIAAGDSPYGYGVVKIDRDSKLIWTYLEHTHHDIDIGPDGRIYTLTQAFKTKPIEELEGLETPYSDEAVAVLSPEGKQLQHIPMISALVHSKYEELLERQPHHPFNPLHTNGIELITAVNQDNFPFGEPGDVLLSFRNINTVAVLDLDSEQIIWAKHGYWLQQHDADLLANGDIMVFDNYGHFVDNNFSRVLEFNPVTMKRTWVYHGSKEHPLYSEIRSAAQRLPNGNTLITESNGGRLLEVTPDDDIVWEYYNPVRATEDGTVYTPVVSSGLRIDPGYFTPEFRALLGKHRDSQNAQPPAP